MDGNGRWAAMKGKPRIFGHNNAVKSVEEAIEASIEAGIPYLSLYAFSEENWGRPADEVSGLMALLGSSIDRELDRMIRNDIRCIVLGNRQRLPEKLQEAISNAEKLTSGGKRLTLIVFLSYSGKWDILQAVRRIAAKAAENPSVADDISMETVAEHLVTAGIPDPDLIIRTSGEQRISNYLLWQGAYSEFYFTDTLWPDFRKEDFKKAIEEYSGRGRRYGKV